MRYGFINNFSQALAADLAAGATTMTLDGGGAQIVNPSFRNVYKLTLFDSDGNIEVVNVKGASGNTLTIDGEQEGTTRPAAGWPTGTSVEQRLTAEVATGFFWALPNDGLGENAVSIQPARNNANQLASAFGAVAIGVYSEAGASNATALGPDSHAIAGDSLAVGRATFARQGSSVAVGQNADCDSELAICLGSYSQGYALSSYGIALGPYANFEGEGAISIGHYASTFGNGQMALGPSAYPNQIQSAMDITAIPVMKPNASTPRSYQHATAMRVTLPVMLRSLDVSMASTGDKDSIGLPANTRLMVDRIETIVISSGATTYTPTVSIGTTLGGADILSGYIMAGSTVLRREQLVSTPLADAVTALYFKVDSASAGAMAVRFIVHGYVMEI